MSSKTFEELKLRGELPSPTGVGMRILELTRSEDYSTQELGDTIRADPALTGRVLKLANSASMATCEPATTVTDAIMRLGVRAVRDVSLAFTLVSANRGTGGHAFDYSAYWARSLARAVSAGEIGHVSDEDPAEEAYICGLVAELGKLAFAAVYEDRYPELLANAGGDRERLLRLERQAFDIDHLQVTQGLIQDWGLPEEFSEAVACLASPASERPDPTGLQTTLRLANAFSALLVEPHATRESFLLHLPAVHALRTHLGIDGDEFGAFFDRCVAALSSWAKIFEISVNDDISYALFVELTEGDVCDRAESRASREEDGRERPGAANATERSSRDPMDIEAMLGADPSHVFGATKEEEDEPEAPIRVLAVDDDRVTLKILVRHLERGGFEVIQANDGREGLKLALSCNPEIVMSDWVMPKMDGVELCKELRRTESGRHMYFLLLTGRSEEERVVQAFEAGVDDYVTKPFIPRILTARIKGGLRLVNLQRQVEKDKRIMMQQFADLGRMARRLQAAAFTDALTELPNRRYAMKQLESEWASIARSGRPLTLILFDIDHFKSVNDNFGHDIGDVVLRKVAQTVKDQVRASDEVCRIGGEEFVIICKNTDLREGGFVAERIRSAVESCVIPDGGFNRSVTLSLGVAGTVGAEGTFNELLKRADEAVYEAKGSGRNKVCIDTGDDSERRSA